MDKIIWQTSDAVEAAFILPNFGVKFPWDILDYFSTMTCTMWALYATPKAILIVEGVLLNSPKKLIELAPLLKDVSDWEIKDWDLKLQSYAGDWL